MTKKKKKRYKEKYCGLVKFDMHIRPAEHLGPKCVCVGGGGVTLIFSYIRRLGSSFWVQNFEFQYFWGVSEKIIMFGV